MSIKTYQNEAQKINTVLSLNIQFLRFHHPEISFLFETLLNKSEAIIITETSLTENDLLKKLDINGYQPIESKPRKSMKRRSSGIPFNFEERREYYPFEFKTNIAGSIFRAFFGKKYDFLRNLWSSIIKTASKVCGIRKLTTFFEIFE